MDGRGEKLFSSFFSVSLVVLGPTRQRLLEVLCDCLPSPRRGRGGGGYEMEPLVFTTFRLVLWIMSRFFRYRRVRNLELICVLALGSVARRR